VCAIHNHCVSGLCPSFGILNNLKIQCFGNWICFRLQAIAGRHLICWVPGSLIWLALSKGPNIVAVSTPSSQDRNWSRFWSIAFPNYLEYRTMHKVHKLSDSECYTPSLEAYRLHHSHKTLDSILMPVLQLRGIYFIPCFDSGLPHSGLKYCLRC
jgi:hypothetical protein